MLPKTLIKFLHAWKITVNLSLFSTLTFGMFTKIHIDIKVYRLWLDVVVVTRVKMVVLQFVTLSSSGYYPKCGGIPS